MQNIQWWFHRENVLIKHITSIVDNMQLNAFHMNDKTECFFPESETKRLNFLPPLVIFLLFILVSSLLLNTHTHTQRQTHTYTHTYTHTHTLWFNREKQNSLQRLTFFQFGARSSFNALVTFENVFGGEHWLTNQRLHRSLYVIGICVCQTSPHEQDVTQDQFFSGV